MTFIGVLSWLSGNAGDMAFQTPISEPPNWSHSVVSSLQFCLLRGKHSAACRGILQLIAAWNFVRPWRLPDMKSGACPALLK